MSNISRLSMEVDMFICEVINLERRHYNAKVMSNKLDWMIRQKGSPLHYLLNHDPVCLTHERDAVKECMTDLLGDIKYYEAREYSSDKMYKGVLSYVNNMLGRYETELGEADLRSSGYYRRVPIQICFGGLCSGK